MSGDTLKIRHWRPRSSPRNQRGREARKQEPERRPARGTKGPRDGGPGVRSLEIQALQKAMREGKPQPLEPALL